MVKIDSESGNEAEFADFIQTTASRMSLKSKTDKYGNVYITSPGEGKPLMLNTHMDTVIPGKGIKPSVKSGYIQSDGRTVLGADSKAGIAAIFEAINVLQEQNVTHRPVLITLTCNEETGIPTASDIKSDIKECVVFDRGAPLGEIILKSPYAQVFQVNIKGQTAYATSNFNDGRHAVLAGCEMVSKLPIGNFDSFSTSNIGLFHGGLMTTTVPDSCFFKGNCYSFKKKSLDLFFRKLRNIINKIDQKYGTDSKIEFLEYFGGYKIDPLDSLAIEVKKAIQNIHLKPSFTIYKTVTNANNLNDIGIKSVLISTGVENQHTLKERIKISSLCKLAEIAFELMTGSKS